MTKKSSQKKDSRLARSLPSLPPQKPESQQTRTKISKRKARAMTEFPEYFDEETTGGSMPNPEADDDTLENIQEWGFYPDADDEHPQEINEEKQLEQAEKSRRKKRTE